MAFTLTKPKQEAGVAINLLPSEVKATQDVRRIFGLALGGAVVLLVILGAVTVFLRMQIASQERTLTDAKAQEAQLQQQVNGLRDIEVMQQNIQRNRTILATALASDISWTRFLDDLDTHMPDGSWLTSVKVTASPGITALGEPSLGTAQYNGFVPNMPALAGWLDTMSEIEGLRFVYLSNGQKQKNGSSDVVAFNASAHMTEKMLSGRCQAEASPCP